MKTICLTASLIALASRAVCSISVSAIASARVFPSNVTVLNEEPAPPWMPSAGTRGTADIIYSCIFTISLCVYTVLHLNIPFEGEKRGWQYLRKAKWTLIGILAPELVLYSAFDQFWTARGLYQSLCKEWDGNCKRIQEEGPYDTLDAERPDFSLIYGFYAVMGGFVMDVSDLHDEYRTITLTPAGIRAFAMRGYFFSIDERTIDDKSKANVMAKGLVFCQVLWMLVQCLARKTAGYPLTILEIHTFVHVLYALGMYTLWFKKPLNVIQGTTVSVEKEGQEILALLLMQADASESLYSFNHDSGEVMHVSVRECDLIHNVLHFAQTINARFADQICRVAALRFQKTSTYTDIDQINKTRLDVQDRHLRMNVTFPACISSGYIARPGGRKKLSAYTPIESKYKEWIVNRDGHVSLVEFTGIFLKSQTYARNFGFFNVKIADETSPERFTNDDPSDSEEIIYTLEYGLSPLTKRRREMGKNAIESMIENGIETDLVPTLEAMQDTPVCLRSSNLPHGLVTRIGSILQATQSLEEAWSSKLWIMEIVLIVATASYGGIHALVWNYRFGTLAERWLWRGSCILLASAAPIMSLTRRISRGILAMLPQDAFITECFYACTWTLLGCFFTNMLGLFAVARFYVVVESFVSLRTVPIGVYASVPWANAIPHL